MNFLFSVWPYMAFSLLAVGMAVRYLLEQKRMDAVRTEMAEAWSIFGGARVWRACVALLLVVHAAVLLLPQSVLIWNGHPLRLYLFEAVAFIAGLAALVGWVKITWQQVSHGNRSVITELSDMVFLALLFVAITSGVLMAALYRWGSSWGALVLTPYIASILRGRPAPGLAMQMPFLVRLHVFSAFAILAVLPLTRLAAFFVFALHSILALIGRPVSNAVHAAERWLRRHNPAPWLWPEED
ncbi:MAG TPA: respiratory nitrate reductase subunit gamma [Candidatus Angelobacter sp.]|nr:respiratory nitrate reductase subunit gamma [Candidatus Angelobacter sp.]